MKLNKRGEGLLYSCVMIVALSMVISVLITFVSTVSLVEGTRRMNRTALDKYVTKSSIEIYHCVKNGHDYASMLGKYFDGTEVLDEIFYQAKFEVRENMFYSYEWDGTERYHITIPVFSSVRPETLHFRLQYTMFVPIRFAGIRVGYAAIPITLESHFTEKFY